jgi:hypothetical protein
MGIREEIKGFSIGLVANLLFPRDQGPHSESFSLKQGQVNMSSLAFYATNQLSAAE